MNLCKYKEDHSAHILQRHYEALNSTGDDEFHEKVASLILAVDFLLSNIVVWLSIFANAVVIYVILTSKRIPKNSPNNFILAILSSDLGMGCWFVYMMTVFMQTEKISKLFPFIYAGGMIVINIQIAMSADRYWALRYPMSYFVHKESKYERWVIAMAVIVGLLTGVPYGFIVILNGYICDGDHDHAIMNNYRKVFDCWTLVAVLSVLALNGSIVSLIMKRRRAMKQLSPSNSAALEINQDAQDNKITVTMLIIVISSCISWIPFAIHDFAVRLSADDYFFVKFFIDDLHSKKAYLFSTVGTVIAKSFIYLNILFDPLIYAFRMKVIQEEVKKSFKRQTTVGKESEHDSGLGALPKKSDSSNESSL